MQFMSRQSAGFYSNHSFSTVLLQLITQKFATCLILDVLLQLTGSPLGTASRLQQPKKDLELFSKSFPFAIIPLAQLSSAYFSSAQLCSALLFTVPLSLILLNSVQLSSTASIACCAAARRPHRCRPRAPAGR